MSAADIEAAKARAAAIAAKLASSAGGASSGISGISNGANSSSSTAAEAAARAREVAARLGVALPPSASQIGTDSYKRNASWDTGDIHGAKRQFLGNGDQMGGHYGPGSGGFGQSTETLQIPNECVGTIIGRSGETIRSIQERTSAHVQIQRDNETPPNATERTVTISGSQDAIQRARDMVHQLVQERQSQLQTSASTSSQSNPQSNYGLVASLQVPIPNDRVGLIIGRAGRTIKGIQDRTGANVQIPKDADANDPSTRTITITATSHEAATSAQQEIEGLVHTDDGNLGNAPGETIYVEIPNDRVGAVIGKSGTTIRDLQERTATRIQVPAEPEPNGMRRVEVRGTDQGCQMARQEILNIISSIGPGGQTGMGGFAQYGAMPQAYGAYGQQYGMYGAQQYPYGAQQQYGMAGGYPAQAMYGQYPQQQQPQQPQQQPQQPQQPYGQQAPNMPQQPQDPMHAEQQAQYQQPTSASMGDAAQQPGSNTTGAPPTNETERAEQWQKFFDYYAQFGWTWDYQTNQWVPASTTETSVAAATMTASTTQSDTTVPTSGTSYADNNQMNSYSNASAPMPSTQTTTDQAPPLPAAP